MKKAYKMDTFCFALFKKQWSILAIINVQINPLRQVDGYMHHWIESALVQIMVKFLLGTKLLITLTKTINCHQTPGTIFIEIWFGYNNLFPEN